MKINFLLLAILIINIANSQLLQNISRNDIPLLAAPTYSPRIFAQKTIMNPSQVLQFPNQNIQIPSLSDCPCAGEASKCPDCSSSFETISCDCAPSVACPPCVLAKTEKQMHELASSNVI